MEQEITDLVTRLGTALTQRGWFLATAESCTGGLVACRLTDVSGSSAWYVGGVVAYANHIKEKILEVPGDVLSQYGAVSEETALAMARGAARRFGAQCSLAISGVAGPLGGSPEKPVGTVWIGWSVDGHSSAERFLFKGDRLSVKDQSARAALQGLLARL